jgi:hypothetical protein
MPAGTVGAAGRSRGKCRERLLIGAHAGFYEGAVFFVQAARLVGNLDEQTPFGVQLMLRIQRREQGLHALAIEAHVSTLQQSLAVLAQMGDVQEQLALADSRSSQRVGMTLMEKLALLRQDINQRLSAGSLRPYCCSE